MVINRFGAFGVVPVIMLVMFFVIFVIVFAMIITVFVKMAKQKRYNDAQPRLSVDATVVSRRTDRTVSGRNGNMSTVHSTSWYYVTFEFESGDRMEFSVSGQEYGMLAEGDHGKLSFQGTRYLGFERYR